uniref:GRIP domain-containing protein n=1 Tax=Caenorhabditis tropicalis TaxID=1561998 RepID=A0A1I7T273_9PELO
MVFAQTVISTKNVATSKTCRNRTYEGKKSTLDCLLHELECIPSDIHKEEFDLVISTLEEKLEQVTESKKLVTTMLQEVFGVNRDENSLQSEGKTNDSIVKSKSMAHRKNQSDLLSVESNRVFVESLPEGLKNLVTGALNASQEEIEYIIPSLATKLTEIETIIGFVKQQRDNFASQQSDLTVSDEVPNFSDSSSENVAALGCSKVLADALDEANKEISFLRLELGHCYSNLKDEKISETCEEKLETQQREDANQKTVEEKDFAYQKLLAEKETLFCKVEEIQKVNQQLKEDLAAERQTSKSNQKKIRKEKDSIIKKQRRSIEDLQSNNKILSDKLADIPTKENVSHTSVEFAQSSAQHSDQISDSKLIDDTSNSQNDVESLQKCYEDVCQQLETSEKSLEVQQELNANITKATAESRTKHTTEIAERENEILRLKNNIEKQSEELLRIKELERKRLMF